MKVVMSESVELIIISAPKRAITKQQSFLISQELTVKRRLFGHDFNCDLG